MKYQNCDDIPPNTLVVLYMDPSKCDSNHIATMESILDVKNMHGREEYMDDVHPNDMVFCLGEISNMAGHYAFVTNNRKRPFTFGLHPDSFAIPTERTFEEDET